MKNNLWNFLGVFIIIATLSFVYFEYSGSPTNNLLSENGELRIDGGYKRDAIIYETEVDSEDECTSYEQYDKERKICFYKCEDEAECKETEDSINTELESWSDQEQADESPVNEKSFKDNFTATASYKIFKGEVLKFKNGTDKKEYKSIWTNIAELSPDELSDKYLETFEVFNQPNDETLAFVSDDDKNGLWNVSVNIGIFNDQSIREQKVTLIHELAHVISLNTSQIKKQEKCLNLKLDEGCADQYSYINTFWEKYWKGIKTPKFDENKYVTEYATTNEAEDFAESFASYVIEKDKNKLGNTFKDDKLKFFYSYPELVKIREDMRNILGREIVRNRKLNQSSED